MQSVQEILGSTFKSLGINKKYNIESAMVHWPDIVGPDIAMRSQPIKIEWGIMLLMVSNSVWCHHLSMLKEDIMYKMNHFIGEKLIQDIRFMAGTIKKKQNEEQDSADIDHYDSIMAQLSTIYLTDRERMLAETMVENIVDIDLRELILQIIQKDVSLTKCKIAHEWHQCASCLTLCPPDKIYCITCTLANKKNLQNLIRKTLSEAPWLKYHELNQYVCCTPSEYDRAKDDLIIRLSHNFDTHDGIVDKVTAMTLTMLTTCLTPDTINDEIMNQTLEKFRRKKYVPTPGR